jgi:hypothetical protein
MDYITFSTLFWETIKDNDLENFKILNQIKPFTSMAGHIISVDVESLGRYGRIEMTNYFLGLFKDTAFYDNIVYQIYHEAIVFNQFDLIFWLNNILEPRIIFRYENLKTAVLAGNFDLVKWLIENGVLTYPELNIHACRANNLEILKYFHNSGIEELSEEFAMEYYSGAAVAGGFEIIKWLFEHDMEIEVLDRSLESVIIFGYLDILLFFCRDGLTLNPELTKKAIKKFGKNFKCQQ